MQQQLYQQHLNSVIWSNRGRYEKDDNPFNGETISDIQIIPKDRWNKPPRGIFYYKHKSNSSKHNAHKAVIEACSFVSF